MIVACYQRTMAGAAQRAAERGRTLVMELPAPKPKLVVAPEPPQRVVRLPQTPFHERIRIIDLIARMHRCSLAQVRSPSRAYKIVNARMAAICAIAEFESQIGRKMSLSHLGRIFGRDHTSIHRTFRKRGYQERPK